MGETGDLGGVGVGCEEEIGRKGGVGEGRTGGRPIPKGVVTYTQILSFVKHGQTSSLVY